MNVCEPVCAKRQILFTASLHLPREYAHCLAFWFPTWRLHASKGQDRLSNAAGYMLYTKVNAKTMHQLTFGVFK